MGNTHLFLTLDLVDLKRVHDTQTYELVNDIHQLEILIDLKSSSLGDDLLKNLK